MSSVAQGPMADLLLEKIDVTAAGRLIRLGNERYGWWIDGDRIAPGEVCLNAGVGEDISFDIDLSEQFDCHIHLIDPTPRALAHWHAIGATMLPEQRARFTYHPKGLWHEDTIQRFYGPQNPAHVSHSIMNLQKTNCYFEAPCISLQTLWDRLGNPPVGLIKLDIEGAEYTVLHHLLTTPIRPKVLCVEFDEGHTPINDAWQTRILACTESLEAAGYALVQLEWANATFVLKAPTDRSYFPRHAGI